MTSPQFADPPPEPVAENLGELAALVKATGADIGFATDPDVDRLALGAIVDLMTATGAISHHNGIGLLTHGGQQAQFCHLH